MNNNSSKQILLSVLGVAILVVAVVGVSFAAFTYTGTGDKENTIATGAITMNYTQGEKGINITDAMPVSDAIGKTITAEDAQGAGTVAEEGAGVFDFSVVATMSGKATIKYDIMAQKSSGTLPETAAKLYLQKDTTDETMAAATDVLNPTTFNSLGEASTATTAAAQALGTGYKVLHSDTFNAAGNHYYRLRMWVDEDYQVPEKSQNFTVIVHVYGEI